MTSLIGRNVTAAYSNKIPEGYCIHLPNLKRSAQWSQSYKENETQSRQSLISSYTQTSLKMRDSEHCRSIILQITVLSLYYKVKVYHTLTKLHVDAIYSESNCCPEELPMGSQMAKMAGFTLSISKYQTTI